MNIIYPVVQDTPESREELKGVTEADLNEVLDFFKKIELSQNPNISIALAEVDAILVKDYSAKVVSRFTDAESGDLFVGTADGHFVNVSQMVRDVAEML